MYTQERSVLANTLLYFARNLRWYWYLIYHPLTWKQFSFSFLFLALFYRLGNSNSYSSDLTSSADVYGAVSVISHVVSILSCFLQICPYLLKADLLEYSFVCFIDTPHFNLSVCNSPTLYLGVPCL